MQSYQRSDRKGWWWKYKHPITGKWTGHIKVGDTQDEAAIRISAIKKDNILIETGLVTPSQLQIKKQSQKPIGTILNEFDKHLKGKKTSPERRKKVLSSVRRIVKDCQFKTLAQFDPQEVEFWLADRLDVVGVCTRNEDLQAANQLMRWCVKKRKLADNPLAGIEKLNAKKDRRRQARSLTPRELSVILRKVPRINPTRGLYYLVLARTGLRWSELKRMRWSHVDLKNGWVEIGAGEAKNGRDGLLPLSQDLIQRLQPVKGRDDEKLFKTQPTRLTWQRDMQRCRIQKRLQAGYAFRKSLRRTFGTHLAISGVDLRTTQKLMRHSDPSLTANLYTDPYLLDMAGAVNGLENLGTKWGPKTRPNMVKLNQHENGPKKKGVG